MSTTTTVKAAPVCFGLRRRPDTGQAVPLATCRDCSDRQACGAFLQFDRLEAVDRFYRIRVEEIENSRPYRGRC
jgi:hypothetical protein